MTPEEATIADQLARIDKSGADDSPWDDPNRCRGCGAMPEQSCAEECPVREIGPVWPGPDDDFVQNRHADLDPNADEAEPEPADFQRGEA